jgi:hypothetical protein
MEPTDLCVPIYLNQQIVFDLLAILDDGFSNFSTIKTSNTEAQSQCADAAGSVGLSNVFAFIGLSLKAELSTQKGGQEQREVSQQKIHTPTSLFAKLKLMLDESNVKMLKQIDSREKINELNGGDFVEFRAILKKNPLIDALEGLKKIMELVILFADKGSEMQKVKKGQKTIAPQSNYQPVMTLLDGMLASLTQSNSLELVGELIEAPDTRAVISTKLNYFSDKNATEIIDGEFRVLGKVVRIIKTDSDTPINLLRKTSFGLLDSKILNQFKNAFEGVEKAGMKIPELITEIRGPALVVIPIAMFT